MRAKFNASVIGIILLDTPYTGDWKTLRLSKTSVYPELPLNIHPAIRQNVMRRFEESEALVENWEIPPELAVARGSEGERPADMPPALLVRASEWVPVKDDKVLDIDIHRSDRLLGWECCRGGWIQEVVEVKANHYNMFDDSDKVRNSVRSATHSAKPILRSADLQVIGCMLLKGNTVMVPGP